jgi:hypothetical protein
MTKLAALLLLCVSSVALAENHDPLRFELQAGACKYQLAPEGSWWYEGYQTDVKLTVPCHQVGISWLPVKRGTWRFGVRGSYVDLGEVKANNDFPAVEDGSQNDHRVNPAGPVGSYSGSGGAWGWTLGPVAEWSTGRWTVSGELGAAYLWTWWHVTQASIDGVPININWRYADGYKWTSYLGLGAHYSIDKAWRVDLSLRRYSQVHASQAEVNSEYIGIFSGPVYSLMLGASYAF